MLKGDRYTVHIGNNLDILPTLEDNSVDSIVTDPPYELGFMGKKWDSTGIAYNSDLWRECLRVLKPGGHLLSFGGSRTWHRIAVAIEDAGFEVRDSIAWLYGSGFPKSLDISKAIDKAAGAKRKVVGKQRLSGNAAQSIKEKGGTFASNTNSIGVKPIDIDITAPATPEAQQWEGWGTALKPTVEPIVMARKPLIGTVAENVLTYGTGGLNIDGSRISADMSEFYSGTGKPRSGKGHLRSYGAEGEFGGESANPPSSLGRWPANVILDEHTAELLDEQSGQIKGGTWNTTDGARHFNNNGLNTGYKTNKTDNSVGGASRFFYVAKASKRDRNEGLEHLEQIVTGSFDGNADLQNDRKIGANPSQPNQPRQNFHPTVKPTDLMRYLIKLVTPPNGVVLDPFTGSGSTGKAAILEGFRFIGIEMTEDYIPIIEGRLKHAEAEINKGLF